MPWHSITCESFHISPLKSLPFYKTERFCLWSWTLWTSCQVLLLNEKQWQTEEINCLCNLIFFEGNSNYENCLRKWRMWRKILVYWLFSSMVAAKYPIFTINHFLTQTAFEEEQDLTWLEKRNLHLYFFEKAKSASSLEGVIKTSFYCLSSSPPFYNDPLLM